MSNINYNPFTKPDVIPTYHGILNIASSRYVTHRKDFYIHQDVKGFLIEITEFSICQRELIRDIIIKLHNGKTTIYKIPTKYVSLMKHVLDDERNCIHIPICELEEVGVEDNGM